MRPRTERQTFSSPCLHLFTATTALIIVLRFMPTEPLSRIAFANILPRLSNLISKVANQQFQITISNHRSTEKMSTLQRQIGLRSMTKGRSDFKAFGIIAFCDVTVISYRKRCFSVYLIINSFFTAASQVLHSTNSRRGKERQRRGDS